MTTTVSTTFSSVFLMAGLIAAASALTTTNRLGLTTFRFREEELAAVVTEKVFTSRDSIESCSAALGIIELRFFSFNERRLENEWLCERVAGTR